MTKSRRASWIALVIGASVTVFWLAISARYLESAFGWDALMTTNLQERLMISFTLASFLE